MAESVSDPTIDPYSPYHIDLESHFNYFFPTIKLCQAEDNYVFWKPRFVNFFRMANKLGFVDGTISKPDPSSPLYDPWKRCDALVKLWMMNSMTEKLQELVMYAETAQKMWEDIRRIFVPSIDLKIYEIRRRIAMTRQGGDSVATYYGKLNKAWMELSEYAPDPKCSCGGCKCEVRKLAEEAREKEKRFAFLMGLNKSLSSVATILLSKKSPPSVYEVYVMVERVESDMKMRRR